MARPMPEVEPVTTAVLEASDIVGLLVVKSVMNFAATIYIALYCILKIGAVRFAWPPLRNKSRAPKFPML